MNGLYTELQSETAAIDSQAMWDKFASRLQQGIDKHIPTRSSGTKPGSLNTNEKEQQTLQALVKVRKT